ncbi:hypothetical protein BOS5A_230019 [Bosea sp. EC-HK365B]|nr:hypothetical protein BOSE21B_150034 [Bosea sp. 21B]CAD5300680.1 hypothetical protein BOSE7B_90061 [Bosea sp. 7B]VVT60742.1 hypothetical protein BOS5A_230019 [Bosea sp. EC-HK365B]VXC59924.1 hypothetical protein BOSE127_230034 [Bosea sp. 127]
MDEGAPRVGGDRVKDRRSRPPEAARGGAEMRSILGVPRVLEAGSAGRTMARPESPSSSRGKHQGR